MFAELTYVVLGGEHLHSGCDNSDPRTRRGEGPLLSSMMRNVVIRREDSGGAHSTTLFFNLGLESSLRAFLVSSGDSLLMSRTTPFLERSLPTTLDFQSRSRSTIKSVILS
jgi:hypothetical protein